MDDKQKILIWFGITAFGILVICGLRYQESRMAHVERMKQIENEEKQILLDQPRVGNEDKLILPASRRFR